MNKVKKLTELFPDEEFLIADGLDAAIVGVEAEGERRVVYDYDKMIKVFMKEGMTEEDAMEHISYNVMGAYVGDKTPLFIQTL
jgi:uncharacterized protein YpmB